MPDIVIVLGSKNTSSWSLRPWLALKQTGAPFDEIVIPLDRPETKAAIAGHSPSGKVPALKHGGVVVWDSLAICEYLAETFPAALLWPKEPAARAVARAVSAEMHAGFAALRRTLPMDIRRRTSPPPLSGEVAADIDRVGRIWRDCRGRFGADGDMLFGRFTIADAMFAPVTTRFVTYGVALDEVSAAYVEAATNRPAMREWAAAAAAEP